MARKIRFPLKMSNGTEVRTLDELRANFDLNAVLGYYADGKLVTWLRDRYFENEANAVEALDKTSATFQNDLCGILGVTLSPDTDEEAFDEEYILRRNEKRALLRDLTDDEKIINSVDSAVFDQDDLYNIYDLGKHEIYLCKGEFEIPINITGVTYIGIADPTVKLRSGSFADYESKGIKFVNCGEDATTEDHNDNAAEKIDEDYESMDVDKFRDKEKFEALKQRAAEQNPGALYKLAECYSKGIRGKVDMKNALRWYKAAAAQGHVKAQFTLGETYFKGEYAPRDKQVAIRWYTKAAMQGYVKAELALGDCYFNGDGVPENMELAKKWYTLAEAQGSIKASVMLTQLPNYNSGIEKASDTSVSKIENAVCGRVREVVNNFLEEKRK